MIRRVALALLIGWPLGFAAAQPLPKLAVTQLGTARTEEFVRKFVEGMAAHDPDRIASLFTETGTVFTPEGPVVSGRAQIRALYSRVLAANQVTMTFVRAQSDGDQENAVLLWAWDLQVAQPGRDTVHMQVRSMLHLKNTPAGWLISSDLYQVAPAR